MKRVKLTKITSVHSNLRTVTVEGFTSDWPKVGERFLLIAEALDPTMNVRIVETTPIQEITHAEFNGSGILQQGDKLEFKTENSTYGLEILSV